VDETELRQLISRLMHELRAEGHLEDEGEIDLLALSSLELLRLLVEIEESLDIELDDELIMNAQFATIDDIIQLVHAGMDAASSPR